MPMFRITLDIEADTHQNATTKAVLGAILGNGKIVGVDALTEPGALNYPAVRTVTFYRRATTAADTPGDFLPHTQPCSDTMCEEIAIALIGYSDGAEVKVCSGHQQEYAGVLLQHELVTEVD